MYCAVTGSSNTVWAPSVTSIESLVQLTVVAGPPVEIQVRVFMDKFTPPTILISPIRRACEQPSVSFDVNTIYLSNKL